MNSTTSRSLTPRHIASRVAASLLGGYAFVWGFTALGWALLLAAGMPFNDARRLVMLIAFVVLLGVFCWAFVAASLKRVWMVLAGGGAVMTAAAAVLQWGAL